MAMTLLHTNQTEQGAWADWSILDESSKLSQVVSALDGDVRLAVGWLNNGQIWVSAANQPNGDLPNAFALDSQELQQLKLLTNKNGRFEFLALSLEGTELQQIAGTSYGDGRLTAVALGKDKQVYRKEQDGPGGAWGAWEGLGGTDIQGIAAAENADGDLVVAVTGGNGALYNFNQTLGGVSSGWQTLAVSGNFVLCPQLARNQDGHLDVFVYDNDSFIYHTFQGGPNGEWVSKTVLVEPNTSFQFPNFSATTLTDGHVALLRQLFCDVSLYVQAEPNAHSLSRISNPGTPCSAQIVSFKANPSSAAYGVTTTLSWDVETSKNTGETVRKALRKAQYDVVLMEGYVARAR